MFEIIKSVSEKDEVQLTEEEKDNGDDSRTNDDQIIIVDSRPSELDAIKDEMFKTNKSVKITGNLAALEEGLTSMQIGYRKTYSPVPIHASSSVNPMNEQN